MEQKNINLRNLEGEETHKNHSKNTYFKKASKQKINTMNKFLTKYFSHICL